MNAETSKPRVGKKSETTWGYSEFLTIISLNCDLRVFFQRDRRVMAPLFRRRPAESRVCSLPHQDEAITCTDIYSILQRKKERETQEASIVDRKMLITIRCEEINNEIAKKRISKVSSVYSWALMINGLPLGSSNRSLGLIDIIRWTPKRRIARQSKLDVIPIQIPLVKNEVQ